MLFDKIFTFQSHFSSIISSLASRLYKDAVSRPESRETSHTALVIIVQKHSLLFSTLLHSTLLFTAPQVDTLGGAT